MGEKRRFLSCVARHAVGGWLCIYYEEYKASVFCFGLWIVSVQAATDV